MRIVQVVILLLAFVGCCQAACPVNGCKPFGECVSKFGNQTVPCGDDIDCDESSFCECRKNFGGSDCSIHRWMCDQHNDTNDDFACYNQGTCEVNTYRNTEGHVVRTSYSCNCTRAVPDAMFYNDHCELDPTEKTSCEIGKAYSEFAYCVNGGTCFRMVTATEIFLGCNCPEDYGGRHCQFPKDKVPQWESAYVHELQPPAPEPKPEPYHSDDDDYDDSSSKSSFVPVVVSVVLVGGIASYLYRRRRQTMTFPQRQFHTAPGMEFTDMQYDAHYNGGGGLAQPTRGHSFT